MYSLEYEKRWARLRDYSHLSLAAAACKADGHPLLEGLPHYLAWSDHDLQKVILRSEFPAEASNG